MPLFIKTERFNKETLDMNLEKRKIYILQHKNWIKELVKNDIKIFSGYLVNENKKPGDGGLIILQANNFKEAKSLIIQDPMIQNNLVNWQLNEYIPVYGNLFNFFSGDKFP